MIDTDRLKSLALEGIFWELTHDNFGFYPQSAVGGDSPYEKRTEYMEGWNAAGSDYTKNFYAIKKWHESIPGEYRALLDDLLLNGHVNVHVGNDNCSLWVDCSDVFAWGCSDAEDIQLDELHQLHEFCAKDPTYGGTIWCMVKRLEMPQKPVEELINKAGMWDIKALGLRPNYYDGVSGVLARRKHQIYCDWAKSRGEEPIGYVTGWWDGWRKYIDANPNWYTPEWRAEDDRLIQSWREANDHT